MTSITALLNQKMLFEGQLARKTKTLKNLSVCSRPPQDVLIVQYALKQEIKRLKAKIMYVETQIKGYENEENNKNLQKQ